MNCRKHVNYDHSDSDQGSNSPSRTLCPVVLTNKARGKIQGVLLKYLHSHLPQLPTPAGKCLSLIPLDGLQKHVFIHWVRETSIGVEHMGSFRKCVVFRKIWDFHHYMRHEHTQDMPEHSPAYTQKSIVCTEKWVRQAIRKATGFSRKQSTIRMCIKCGYGGNKSLNT